MRIRSLETRNFGRLPDGRIEFSEGLTLVSGPNEAGKSFTIRAIYAALFDEASSSAKEREGWRKWGSDGIFEVSLEMEAGDGVIRLTRDLDKRKAVLEMPDGTELKDKKTVQKTIGALLGLPSLKSFQATACILQDAVRSVDAGDAGLKQLLEGQLAGAGKETEKLIKDLKKEIHKIKPPRAPGILGDLENERDDHAADLERLRGELGALIANKALLDQANRDLQDAGEEYKNLDKAYKGARQYRDADIAYEGASVAFNTAEQNLAEWNTAKTGAGEARKRLNEIGPKLQALAAQADLEAARQEQAALGERLSAWRKSTGAMQKLEKKLKSLAGIEGGDLLRARQLAGEIDIKRSTLFQQLFRVEVEAEKGVAFNISIDGSKFDGSPGEAHHTATVEFPGAGVVRMENVTAGVPELAANLADLQSEYAGLLAKYQAPDLAALEEMSHAYNEVAEDLDAERVKLTKALAGLSPEDLQAEVARSDERVAASQAARDALGQVFATEGDLAASRDNRSSLQREEGELKEALAGHTAILNHLGEENGLKAIRDKALGELAVARSKRDEVAMYACDAEGFASLETRHEDLSSKLAELRTTCDQLTFRVGEATVGEEDVARAEESLAEVEGKIARWEHRKRVFDIISEQIEASRQETLGQFAAGLEARMSEVLSRITDGKYSEVAVDGSLSVSVYSPEKGEWLEMGGDRSLSTGTQDQIFLAARIALLEEIAGKACPPLIMDDTFASFDDMGRKQRAFEVLATLSERNQILYFTCQECPDGLATINIGS